MDVSIRQLKSFIAVAKFKSFTQAAMHLNVSQPTLTVQIKRLEETLGFQLFDRSPRAVVLTRVGIELLPALERILQDLDSILTHAQDSEDRQRGIVRIAALPSFAAGALPDAIREFRDEHPGVSFVLKDAIASRVLNLVRSDEVDLGFTGGETNFADIEHVFSARDQMMVVYPQGHPIDGQRRITPKLLAAYPLVLMDQGTSVRAVTDFGFSKAGLMPSPASEATYMMTAIGMVKARIGVTILPVSAREVAAEPSLRSRKINDPNFSRAVALIKRADRILPPLVEAFAMFLAKRTKTLLRG
ncbi:LysR family transcriptional regulator [Tardiphaga sp.]|jgi:DNA-binding transcriptional LysR family regulator|uniref:LysR family transcriptional regulator n=1 Tax=Tardiphaga sp. TaxID=1926292 RepID=UPI0037D9B199